MWAMQPARTTPQLGAVGDQHHAARIGDNGLGGLHFAIVEIQQCALSSIAEAPMMA